MAQLVGTLKSFPEFNWSNGVSSQDAAMTALQEASFNLPPGEIVGAMLKWQVADGYAWYRVKSASPLQVEHVPFLDGYQVPAAHIRGLRRADVLDQLNRSKRLALLFAKA